MQIYLPIAEMPVNLLLLIGLGAAVGFVSGMFGVGGGFLLTPMLIFIGVPSAVVVASQAPQIAASSLTGALSYWRKGAIDFRLSAVLVAGGLVGTQLGVWFFNAMRAKGLLDSVIVVSYVVLLGGIGLLMLVESVRATLANRRGGAPVIRRAADHAWFERMPLRMRFPKSGRYFSVIPLALVTVGVGFAGAVLGIGGGFIMVPALIYLFRIPTQVVVGSSLVQVLCSMVAATMLHAGTSHTVDVFLALALILGGVFGAQFGARAGANLRGEYFRMLLAVMLFGVAARFAIDILAKPVEPFSVSATETVR